MKTKDMGLDVSVLTDLKKVADKGCPPDDGDYDWVLTEWCDDPQQYRMGSVEQGYYKGHVRYSFQAGPYSYYGKWRKELCQVANQCTAEHMWEHPTGQHVILWKCVELICFTDCDGTLGPEVCTKLHSELLRVASEAGEEFLDQQLTRCFLEAFNTARLHNGVVLFH